MGCAHGDTPGRNERRAGRMCRASDAKSMTSPMATTNSGSAVTASAMTERTLSNQPSRRAAASMPRADADRRVPMMPASSTRTAELVMRGPTRCATVSPLASELPRLPLNTPEIQSQYWTTMGRLRCSCFSRILTRSGVACWPRTA